MKQGKYEREKIKVIDRYLVLVIIAILALGIAYAQITSQELTVSGNAETEVQEGVFISQVTYKSNVGADTENSEINYYLGTMMDSKITLGSSSTSTISYDVTVYNNTDKEQIFIKTITDDTDEILYSNTNIGYTVSLEDYVTTIAPKQSLTFTITFAYNGTDTSNPVLESKLNFRFREKPVIELSNEGTKYTLEEISARHTEEYQFTVKNNNTTYTNGVPVTYSFETTLTEGSPLTAEIYDTSGNKVTGAVTLTSDGTKVENTYTLKLIWDSSKTEEEYEGKEYSCNVVLKATPTDTKYIDYIITKEFNIDITTCAHNNYADGICTICGKTCNHNYGEWETVTEVTCTVAGSKQRTCSICKNVETQTIAATGEHTYTTSSKPAGAGTKYTTTAKYSDGTNTAMIPAGFTVSGLGNKICTKCGEIQEVTGNEATIEEGLVIYLIDDKTDEEIAAIDWDDEEEVLNLQKTYDQFVWIPIPKENINDMYMCQSEDGTKSCNITVQAVNGEEVAYCTTHSSTAMAGRLYTTSTENNFNASLTTQTYNANSGLREPAVVTGNSSGTGTSYDASTTYLAQVNGILSTSYASASDFKTDLQSEYNEVVKSVYENQGFYVGRYETSGMAKSETSYDVAVVAGTLPSVQTDWYHMYAQQKNYAKANSLTVGSTMIQGAAYDQVMKFVNTASYSAIYPINVGHGFSERYNTGSQSTDQSKNIFDLEGNVRAWTTEAVSNCYRISRGGNYRYDGSACYRDIYYPDYSILNNHLGSLCQLYVK